jgi:hypothetical protein
MSAIINDKYLQKKNNKKISTQIFNKQTMSSIIKKLFKRIKDNTQHIILKLSLEDIKIYLIFSFKWKGIKYFCSYTNHPSFTVLSITKLDIQIVFMKGVLTMIIRILSSTCLIFYYKT